MFGDQTRIQHDDGGGLCAASHPFAPVATSERLLDVLWSPAGNGVLVVAQQPVKGGNHFHLLFVERVKLVTWPSWRDNIAGSWASNRTHC